MFFKTASQLDLSSARTIPILFFCYLLLTYDNSLRNHSKFYYFIISY